MRRWFEEHPPKVSSWHEWGAVRITPDLRAVALQAPKARPVLVPPSSLEHQIREDPRLHAELCAEYRSKGYAVDTVSDLLESIEREKREEAQVLEIKERAQQRLGTASLEHSDSPEPTSPGALGFTDKNRRCLKRACGVLAEYRGRIAMLTTTLSRKACEALAWVPNGWNEVLRRFRRRLSRYLRRMGLPLLAVDVTEIQLKRYRETGVPAPHMHMAFVGRNQASASSPWAVSKESVRLMWDRSVNEVAMLDASETHRTRIEAVKHDVFGYLGKYLSKGAETTSLPWFEWVGLQPKRWWNQSKEMKAAVDARTIEVDGNFATWVETNESRLVEADLIRPLKRHCPEDLPIGEVITWSFTRVTAIRDCLRLYLRDVETVRQEWLRRLEIVDPDPDVVLPFALTVPSREFEANYLFTIPVSHPGCFSDRIRKSIQLFERNCQVAVPVLLPFMGFREENAAQLELSLS